MEYLALLRGINVGGKNRIEMSRLKIMMEDLGFRDVLTYINSGNVIFNAVGKDPGPSIETAILKCFGFEIKVLVITKKELSEIVGLVDAMIVNDASMRCDVIFFDDSVVSESFFEHCHVKEGIDTVYRHQRALVWRCDRENVSRSGLKRLLQHPNYRNVSIRNINTSRKVLQLMNT